MFAGLKNKIKEETGKEVAPLPQRMATQGRLQRSAFGSTSSQLAGDAASFAAGGQQFQQLHQQFQQQHAELEQRNIEVAALRLQCADLGAQLDDAGRLTEAMRKDLERLEQSNQLLEESMKVAQMQKELIYDEQDKIQNIQLQEISKLKGLLNFREQEAVDQMAVLKQHQQQIDALKSDNQRLRLLESQHDDIQDEYEKLKHSAQLVRNNNSTAMALLEEQNRHLSDRVRILENSHAEFTGTLSRDDEPVQRLLAERQLLEQRLEEAHLHLADIKSTWSAQNLALETQVSRLSHQVAAETTEKRKALTSQDDQVERIKRTEFELEKCRTELEQRDCKIRLLTEEIDDLNVTLNELRAESEEDVQFLRSKVTKTEDERETLRIRLDTAESRMAELAEQNDAAEAQLRQHKQTMAERADEAAEILRQQTETLRLEVQRLSDALENETSGHRTTALKNAEISQELAKLRQTLADESSECTELNDTIEGLNSRLAEREAEIAELRTNADTLRATVNGHSQIQTNVNDLNNEIAEKNKEIKMLKQRLVDFKRTLQDELKSAQQFDTTAAAAGTAALIDVDHISNGHNGIGGGGVHRRQSNQNVTGEIAMTEVNFMYLKHVIMKFLTCRDVEARQMVRAVATLLQLSKDEEKQLHNSVEHKGGWFSIRNGIVM